MAQKNQNERLKNIIARLEKYGNKPLHKIRVKIEECYQPIDIRSKKVTALESESKLSDDETWCVVYHDGFSFQYECVAPLSVGCDYASSLQWNSSTRHRNGENGRVFNDVIYARDILGKLGGWWCLEYTDDEGNVAQILDKGDGFPHDDEWKKRVSEEGSRLFPVDGSSGADRGAKLLGEGLEHFADENGNIDPETEQALNKIASGSHEVARFLLRSNKKYVFAGLKFKAGRKPRKKLEAWEVAILGLLKDKPEAQWSQIRDHLFKCNLARRGEGYKIILTTQLEDGRLSLKVRTMSEGTFKNRISQLKTKFHE